MKNKPIIPITNLESFKVRISQIPAFDVAFKEMALSDYELLVATIKRLNELIGINQKYIDLTEDTLNWLINDGLTLEVTNKLIEWLNDGTLENLINDVLFESKLDEDVFNDFKDNLDIRLNNLKTDLEDDIEDLETTIGKEINTLNQNIDLIKDKFVNVKEFGAKGDGVTDDTEAIQNALDTYKPIYLPTGTYCISDTLVMNSRMVMFGDQRHRGWTVNQKSTYIKWCGGTHILKPMIQISSNEIGENDPNKSAGEVILNNIVLDGDNKIGFGIYGTYIVNESELSNITVKRTTQHAIFIIKSWFAKYNNLNAIDNMGSGISFGMPLWLMDGTEIAISGYVEVNGCQINGLRAHRCGKYFETRAYTENNYKHGYGLGFGRGHGFYVNNFQTESIQGVGVYYRGDGNMRTLNQGYIESCGLAMSGTPIHMIIDDVKALEGADFFTNILFLYRQGIIYHINQNNVNRKKNLKNIHFPLNITSESHLTSMEINKVFIKENVGMGGNQYNFHPNYLSLYEKTKIDTNYSWSLDLSPLGDTYNIVYLKNNTSNPITRFLNTYDKNGQLITNYSINVGSKWEMWRVLSSNVRSIALGGPASSGELEMIIYETGSTIR